MNNQTTNYRPIILWPRGRGDEHITIINSEDFPLNAILNGLGLQSSALRQTFGITDPEAIKQRSELVAFLREYDELRTFLRTAHLEDQLPSTEQSFLAAFQPGMRAQHWLLCDRFIQLIEARQDQAPACLRELADRLRSMLPFEEEERRAVTEILGLLRNSATLGGIIRFPLKNEFIDGKLHLTISEKDELGGAIITLHGHREYGEPVSREADLQYIRNKFGQVHDDPEMSWAFLSAICLNLTRSWRQRRAARRTVFQYDWQEVPKGLASSIVTDISTYLKTALSKTEAASNNPEGYYLYLTFEYSSQGLVVVPLGVQCHLECPNEDAGFSRYLSSFDFYGYSRKVRRKIGRAAVQTDTMKEQLSRALLSNDMVNVMRRGSVLFNFDSAYIPSPHANVEFRWASVQTLYRLDQFRLTTKRMLSNRIFLHRHLDELQEILRALEVIEAAAKKHQLPLCMPTFCEGHSITGQGLIPTQLMLSNMEGGRRRKLVPMHGMPEVNGRMVIVTGGHGEGKTELLHSLPAAIWLAQSGLPVFATSFELNPKKVLGLLFITQRGKGSTIQMYLKKMESILSGIKGHDPSDVLVVLDELGTATQEHDGELLSKKVLQSLQRTGVSVVGSTQIQSLASWSVAELQAIPIRLDRGHQIKPGIGDGQLTRMVKRTGELEKLLK